MHNSVPFWPDLSARARGIERMEENDCPHDELWRTVDQFDVINRYLARYRTIYYRHVLGKMLHEPHRLYTVIDLGAGGCDIPVWLLTQASRLGLNVQIEAWDHDPRMVAYARHKINDEPRLRVRQAHALEDLPEQPVDFVISNHFLHHLTDEQGITLITRWAAVTRKQLIFNDLARSRWSYAGFYLLTLLLGRGTFHRHDGLLSIRRGFTRAELSRMANQAGFPNAHTVESWLPGRLVLTVNGQA